MLGQIVSEVYTVECLASLAESAARRVADIGITARRRGATEDLVRRASDA